MISVIIPTLPGRHEYLEKCLDSLQTHTKNEYEVITVTEGSNWGEACRIGAERATGDYLFFFSDDMEVMEGWEYALHFCDEGILPAPVMYRPGGVIQSGGEWGKLLPDRTSVTYTVLPLLSRDQYELLGPMPEIHYADAALSEIAAAKRVSVVLCHDYRILHHDAKAGRREHKEANSELDRWRSANR